MRYHIPHVFLIVGHSSESNNYDDNEQVRMQESQYSSYLGFSPFHKTSRGGICSANSIRVSLEEMWAEGQCIMRIYLLLRCALVEADESMKEVVACGVVIGTSQVVEDVVLKRQTRELLGEEINLIQEQNQRGGCQAWERKERKQWTHNWSFDEPAWIIYWVKEGKGLFHTVLNRTLREKGNKKRNKTYHALTNWSYLLKLTKNTRAITFSKQWIHFFRSLRWPPTSNNLYVNSPTLNITSVIPVVFTQLHRISWSMGR